MRRVRLILIVIFSVALLATLYLWVHTSQTPEYIAISTDYRGPDGQKMEGFRSCGLYAAQGHIGLLYHTSTSGWLDLGQVPSPHQPARFVWEHSDNPDNDYAGGLSCDELAYQMTFSHFGLSLYDGDEAGMGHMATFNGGLVDSWILVSFLALALVFFLWRHRRAGRMRKAGLCPNCSYDIRTQLLGQGGANCPECGRPILPEKHAV